MKVVHSGWCILFTSMLAMGMEPDIPDQKTENQQIAVLARVCFPDAQQLTKHERESVLIALAELYATHNNQLIRTIQQDRVQEQDKKQLQERVRRAINDVCSDEAHFHREEREQAATRYLTKLMLLALGACMVVHSMWDSIGRGEV